MAQYEKGKSLLEDVMHEVQNIQSASDKKSAKRVKKIKNTSKCIRGFKEQIETMSGKTMDGKQVFRSFNGRTKQVLARFTRPTTTSHMRDIGHRSKLASLIWPSIQPNVRTDLYNYSHEYNAQYQPKNKGPVSMYSMYMKAVMSFGQPVESIDSLVANIGNSVREWCERGYLPVTANSSTYTNKIVI